MALLDSFTTIGGKNSVLFEEEISLLNENYIESDITLCNILKNYMLDKMITNNSDTINSGFYKVKYRETNDYINYVLKEKIMYICSSKKINSSFPSNNIEIYFVNDNGNLLSYKDNQIHNDNLDLIAGEHDVISIISSMLNGLTISDLERKNQAFTYEINSQSDFDNTFLNANWSPASNSMVKFNCRVSANNKNVVIPNNIYRIEGNNNTISNIISFGYSTKVTNYSARYIYNLKLSNSSNNNDCNNPFKGFVNCNNLNNCTSYFRYGNANFSNPRTGFYNCHNLINCIANFISGGGGSFVETVNYGFYNCNFLINCKEYHSSSGSYYTEQKYIEYTNNYDYVVSSCGFVKCTDLINCIGISSNSSSPITLNYCECKNLYSCTSDGYFSETDYHSYSKSFYLCENLYGCYGSRKKLTDFYNYDINYSVFYECKNLNNCYCLVTTKYHTIFNNCNILKDCTGKMLNCTNVFNTEEVLKNQVTYKGPMSIDSFENLWETGHNVKYGDCYTLYGGDGVNYLKTYNNTTILYTSTYPNTIGDIINISNFDAISNGFKLSILDQMYIPLINNCNLLMIGNYGCNIYKNDYDELFIKIEDRSTQTYITSLPSGFLNLNYTFYTELIVSSDDKIIWREPGFWDVMSARTGFVTTI